MDDINARLFALEARVARHERKNEDDMTDICEENLSFSPVIRSGKRFSIALDKPGSRLIITDEDGNKYYTALIKEE